MVAIVTGSGLGLSGASSSVLGLGGQLGTSALGAAGEGISVNAKTGNLIVQRQDELLAGCGPDIGVVRTYNSNATFDFDNNDSWQLSLYKKLGSLTGTVNTAGSTIRRTGADGAQLTYTYDTALGQYLNQDGGGAYDTLSYSSASNTWTWTDGASQLSETYEASPTAGEWRITGQRDLDANPLTYTYDANGLITQVSDANGETTQLIYDAATKRLSSIQVVTGAVTTTRIRYTYDTSDRLSTVSTDLTPADGSIADGKTYTTTYTYDGTSTRLASLVNSDGTQVSFTYDTSFRVKTVVDGAGKITTFTYNADNTTVTDPLGQTSTLTYDANGNLTQLQGPSGSGQNILYAYNSNGDLTQLTDSRGNAITYSYDANGNLIRQQDAAGNVVERAYNSANQRIQETVYAVPDPDGVGVASASLPQTTYAVYDAKQHLRFTVSPEGRVTEYRYNAQGQQVTSLAYTAGTFAVGGTAPLEADLVTWVAAQVKTGLQRTDVAYDARGLATTVTRFAKTDAAGAGLADGSQSVTQYVYDSAGRLLQQIDPRGVATTGVASDYLTAYAYDGLGRTISLTQYDAAGSAVGSGATRQTLTTFNDALNRVEVSLANGLKRLSTFDQRGLLVSQVEQDGATALSTQSYQYDADGQLRVITDAIGNKTYCLYDNAGRKVGEIDATGGLTEFIYDNAGLVIKTIRHSLRVSQSLIDALAADPASGTVTRSILPNALAGWGMGVGVGGVAGNFTSGTNLNATWQLAGEPTMWLRQSGVEATDSTLYSDGAAVSAGQRYEVAVYSGVHRTTATLSVAFYDAAGNRISQDIVPTGGDPTNAQTQVGGATLAGYKRLWGFITAPAGAVTARLIVHKAPTAAGQADSYLFVTHPYFAEAAATQTVASPFDIRPAASVNDQLSRAIYDGAGRLRLSIDARGYVTENRYDGAGRLLTTLAYANALNNVAGLDTLGREAVPADILLLATAPTASQIGLLLDATNDRVSRSFYDNDGLLRGMLDGEGFLAEYQYDAAGRLTQTIRYGTATTLADRAAGTLGTLITSANATPAKNITSYAYYNGLGQQVGSLDAEGYYTAFQYDVAGNRTRSTRYANRLVGTAVAGSAPQVVASVPGSVPTGGYILSGTQDQTSQATWTAFNQIDTETAVDGSLTKYNYDSVGHRLSAIIAQGAADARTQQARYDKQGRLIQELSALGSQALSALGATPTQAQIDAVWTAYGTTHTYDAAGRRIKSVDANGNQTLFFYDAANRLTYSVTRVRNPANAAEWVGEVSARTFNALGQLTVETRYANRIAATPFATLSGGAEAQIKAAGVIVADAANDSRTDYTYVLTGQLSRSTVKLNATQNAITNRFTNAFGERYATQTALDATRTRQEWFSYDRRGLLTQHQRDTVWSQNASATAVVINTSYDAFGRVVSRTDGNGVVGTVAYDKLGRQIQSVTASGSLNLTHSTTYDAFGRVLTQTDALGKVTSYGYAIDTATGKTTLTVTTPENIVTQTVTDRYGQTLTVVDGLGNETRNVYDANGNLKTSKRWDKAANVETTLTTHTYDTAGLLLLSTQDANGNSVAYSYDAANRTLSRRVDPSGLNLTTTYAYDAKGQQVSVTAPNGVVTQSTYDLAGRVTQIAVDPTDLNLRIQYTYDLAGNQITVVEGYGTSEARTTQYTYDSLGRRTQTAVDPAGLNLVTTYAYDPNDNLVTLVEAAGTALARTTRYSYDSANRLVYVTDALGGVVKNDYDQEGRLLQRTAYANAINLTGLANNASMAAVAALVTTDATRDRTTRHVYDADGRERFTIDALGAVSEAQYDANGNVVKRIAYANALQGTLALGSAPAIVATAPGSGAYVLTGVADRVTTYAYDTFGRLKSQTRASGTSLAQTESYAYDAAGNLLRHTDARGNQEWFAYDQANRLTRHIDQGGYVTDTAWNADGTRKSETRYVNPVALSASDDRWAYQGHAANPVANASLMQVDSFVYDAAGRLITSTDAAGFSEHYGYDANSNKISFTNKKGATWAYAYDTNGRLTSELSPQVAVTTVSQVLDVVQALANIETRIAYDALGNVISRTEAWGRPEARTTSYEYDLLGHQTKVVSPQVGVYAGDNLATNGIDGSVVRTEQSMAPTVVVTYDTLGQAVVNKDAAGNYSYKVYDALGRMIYDVDAEHYATEVRYDSFGNTTRTIRYATALSFDFSRSAAFSASELSSLVVANPADRVLINEYDSLNRLTKVIEPTTDNYDPSAPEGMRYFSAGRITTKTYNATGQVVQQRVLRNPLTNTWSETNFYYDTRGNKTGQVDALGYLTTWAYDETGDVVRQVEYAKALTVGTWSLTAYSAPTATTPQNSPGSAIGYDREVRYEYNQLNQKTAEKRIAIEYASTSGALGINTTVGDLTTRYTYDGVGNLTSTTDNTGAVSYIYYDALGRKTAIAAPSRASDAASGVIFTPLTEFRLDALGNVVEQIDYAKGATSTNSSSYLLDGVGSVDDKRRFTFFDTHSQIVRSVDAEGASTYSSYDALGHQVKEWQAVIDNNGFIQNSIRTFEYDRVGHQTATIEPALLTNRALIDNALHPSIQALSLSFGITSTATYGVTDIWYMGDSACTQFGFIGSNSVTLGWSDLSALGGGNVLVQVDYVTLDRQISQGEYGYYTQPGISASRSVELSSAESATGATITWNETNEHDYGIGSISAVRVYKRDAAGNLVLIHNRTASGTYGQQITLPKPSQPGMVTKLVYRPAAGGNWTTASLTDMGTKYLFNIGGLAANTYQYEALYTRPGESAPSSHAMGTFVVNGATGSLTTGNSTASSYTPPALTPANFIRTQARYNAFGEITAKGINDGWQEHFDYDQAGNLWRSKDQTGVTRVFLHDAQGNATAEIQSQQTNLDSYANSAGVAALTTGVQRTEVEYDLLGRAIRHIQAPFNVDRSLASLDQTVINHALSLSFGFSSNSTYTTGITESGYGTWIPATNWSGSNTISVGWSDLSALGGGNVLVQVDYVTADHQIPLGEYGYQTVYGVSASRSVELSSATGATGTSITWTDTDTASYGIGRISAVRVYKRDAAGTLVLIHNRTTQGANGNLVSWNPPAALDSSVAFKYRLAGTTTWSNAPIIKMGTRQIFDTRSLANGTYEFELTFTRAGEGAPYARSNSTFTRSGDTGSLATTGGGGTLIETIRPTISSTVDRWGNVLTTTDPRNANSVTTNRYNADNKLVEQKLPITDVWGANGLASAVSPSVRSYYDAAGRAIGTVDANGNVNTIRYDAAGQMIAEYHADGGVVQHQYDIFGRQIRSVDTAGNATEYQYDREDRLLKLKRPIGEENYAYDAAGNRIRETNALGQTTYYWYDARGKLIRGRQPMGQETAYAYDVRGNKIRETNANGDTATWSYDYAGHLLGHIDLGGAAFSYTYNLTGQLQTQTNTRGQNLSYSYYENGLLKRVAADSTFVLTAGGATSLAGNSATKTGAMGWGNSDAYSLYGITGGAYASATAGQTNLRGMFGLNADPTTDQNYTSLDYAWYPWSDGNLYIYESGAYVGVFGPYSANDVLTVTYDGANIRYLQNGVVKRTVATTAGRTFHFDSSFYDTGFKLNNIDFGTYNNGTYSNGSETFYEYDAAGNRTRERYTKAGVSYQDNTISYDALGRMTQVRDNRYTLTYSYDANGNRRRSQSSYYDENNVLRNVDNWYLYDSMNRITLSQGVLSNGVIQLDASANPTLQARSGATVSGNSITKTAATGWGNADVVSPNSVTGQAYVSATAGQTNLNGMFGLNSDPVADQNYTSLDYAWYAAAGGSLSIYENGTYIGAFGTYTTSDVLSITYEGTNVVYRLNGVVKRTVATTAGRTFFFDSSLYSTGYQFNNVHFGAAAPHGIQLAYDAAGNRRLATTMEGGLAVTESYNYDANNRLVSTARAGSKTSQRTYDNAGKVTEQITYSSPDVIGERRVSSYNDNGWVTEQNVYNSANTKTQRTLYTAYDALGNNLSYQVSILTGFAYTNYYSTTFAKFDSYKESRVAGSSSYFQPGATTTSYDRNGNVTAVSETFATSKNRTFVTDQAGHILQKTENGKTQNYFYANEKPLGSSGALTGADFDFNYTPVSEQFPSSTPSSYVVSSGDTLRSIALASFGDAQLWYLIADANGLRSDADLQVGRNLVIPNKVTNLRNASDTFKPYAPGKIIGDTTPTLPDPPPPPAPSGKHGGGCGGVGMIIVAIVAIVATIFTAGVASVGIGAALSGGFGATMTAGMGALAGGSLFAAAVGGAVGSILSQGVGMALGVQDKFSWSGVAMGAIGASVGASGIGGAVSGAVGGSVPGAIAGAVVSNVITQGVGVAIGAQKSFSWTSVAAAGIGAGINQAIGQAQYGGEAGFAAAQRSGLANLDFGNSLVRNLGTGVARQLVYGGKANWANVAADAFGNTIANSLVEKASAPNTVFGNAVGNSYTYNQLASGDPTSPYFVGPPNPADNVTGHVSAVRYGEDLLASIESDNGLPRGSLYRSDDVSDAKLIPASQKDTHFSMAKVIFIASGMDPDIAQVAGGASQVLDDDLRKPLDDHNVATTVGSVFWNQSNLTQNHFVLSDPITGQVPSEIKTFGNLSTDYLASPRYQDLYGSLSSTLNDSLAPIEAAAIRLGDISHPVTDTFAHRNEFNVPYDATARIFPLGSGLMGMQLGIGHGFDGSEPDFTYNAPDERIPGRIWNTREDRMLEAASAIYKLGREFTDTAVAQGKMELGKVISWDGIATDNFGQPLSEDSPFVNLKTFVQKYNSIPENEATGFLRKDALANEALRVWGYSTDKRPIDAGVTGYSADDAMRNRQRYLGEDLDPRTAVHWRL